MKKKMFLTGMLALALMIPAPAKAQGWPTFDVAKLASLITNLIGRFQPIPQVLSRVSQVKTTMAQIKATGKAAMAASLKDLGKEASKGLQSKRNSSSGIEDAAKGSNGATASSQKVKSTLFALNRNKELSMDEISKINEARKEYRRSVSADVLSKSFYMATNGSEQSAKRFEKATETMQNAGTIQDSLNANTMMLMAGNFERLNQIVIDLSKLRLTTVRRIDALPTAGFVKPKPIQGLKMGDGVYNEEEKDEADVNFE